MNRQIRHTVFFPVDHLGWEWDLTAPKPLKDRLIRFQYLNWTQFRVV